MIKYLRAHHLSLIALFLALGGTSYAAITLPADSVGTRELKRNAVTLAKIGPSTRRALRGQTGEQGPQGPVGPRGPAGPEGPAGAAGAPGRDATPADLAGEPTTAVGDAPADSGQCSAAAQFCTGSNGWAWRNYGNGYQPVGFWKDRAGIVHLEGVAELYGGAGGGQPAAFILPDGYRPNYIRQFAIIAAANTLKLVNVYPDGRVRPDLGGAGLAPLDGISYRP